MDKNDQCKQIIGFCIDRKSGQSSDLRCSRKATTRCNLCKQHYEMRKRDNLSIKKRKQDVAAENNNNCTIQ